MTGDRGWLFLEHTLSQHSLGSIYLFCFTGFRVIQFLLVMNHFGLGIFVKEFSCNGYFEKILRDT